MQATNGEQQKPSSYRRLLLLGIVMFALNASSLTAWSRSYGQIQLTASRRTALAQLAAANNRAQEIVIAMNDQSARFTMTYTLQPIIEQYEEFDREWAELEDRVTALKMPPEYQSLRQILADAIAAQRRAIVRGQQYAQRGHEPDRLAANMAIAEANRLARDFYEQWTGAYIVERGR